MTPSPGRQPPARSSGRGRQTIEDQEEEEASQQGAVAAGSAGRSRAGAGGGNPDPPPEAAAEPEDDGDDPRRVAHELLGQAHAVLVIATGNEALEYWCPEHLRVSLLEARGDWWTAIGDMQVKIGSGRHDEGLQRNGLGGRPSRHKRKGLREALEQLIKAVGTRNAKLIRAWLKSAGGLARTAVGSMVREIPGGEVVAEALEGILSGIDTADALEIQGPTSR
jgi:hypothetical protein